MKPHQPLFGRAAYSLPILLSLLSACASAPPAPSLWEPGRYSRVLVLPVRMDASTGLPPFTSPDTDLSDRQGRVAQEALALAFTARGYKAVSPADTAERISRERDLLRAVRDLAAAGGLTPREGGDFGEGFVPGASDLGGPSSPTSEPPPLPDWRAPAGQLADAFGTDLVLLAAGRGESHGVGEAIVMGILSRGQGNPPPSFQELTVLAFAPGDQRRWTLLAARGLPWTRDPVSLARSLDRALGRVPRNPSTPGKSFPPPLEP